MLLYTEDKGEKITTHFRQTTTNAKKQQSKHKEYIASTSEENL